MAHSKKNTLPPDFHNPFEGRNPDEVWKELNKGSRPISREEFFRGLQKQRQMKEEKQENASLSPDKKDA